MAIALPVILTFCLLANLAFYGILFALARLATSWMRSRMTPGRAARLLRNGAAAALVLVIAIGAPMARNRFYHHKRQELAAADIAWSGMLAHTKTLAILTDAPEDPNWSDPKECGPRRCRALLYHHVVDAILIALPPPVGARPDPAMPAIRYRLDRRPWCPPIAHMDERAHGRNLDRLAAAAAGECLVSEPATLGDAHIIVLDQTFAPRRIPLDVPTEGVTGERITIYTRAGNGRRALYRKTSVGGSDWAVPFYVGLPNRTPFGELIFGGGALGFMTTHAIQAKPLDLTATMAEHGLGEHDGTVPTDADLAALARRLLADPTIPHGSAAVQFLASYPWLDGWRRNHLDIIAAIIRDPRVTDFPNAHWLERDRETPAELAQPIIDRITASDVSGPPSRTERGQHSAVRTLAEVFSLLPPGAAASEYDELRRLAQDPVRRPYAVAMFSRLADAGPGSLDDLERMVQSGLKEGRSAADKPLWAEGDGCMVPIALYGLTRLGAAARPVAATALAAVKDGLAKDYCRNELRNAGELALLHMGDIAALKSVRPGGNDYLLQELDKDAAWQIGQCGIDFPEIPFDCRARAAQ